MEPVGTFLATELKAPGSNVCDVTLFYTHVTYCMSTPICNTACGCFFILLFHCRGLECNNAPLLETLGNMSVYLSLIKEPLNYSLNLPLPNCVNNACLHVPSSQLGHAWKIWNISFNLILDIYPICVNSRNPVLLPFLDLINVGGSCLGLTENFLE